MKNIRYVYYNKTTGQITDILPKRKRGRSYHIECSLEEVLPILSGKKGITDVIIAYNKQDEKYQLYNKDNIIKLRGNNNTLYKIPYKRKGLFNLKIVVYPDNTMEVILDASMLSNLYTTDFKDEIHFEPGSEFRIIVKEKDTDNLLEEFIISANDLLEETRIYFKLYEHIKIDNIIFYTYKTLDSYYWTKEKMKFLSPHYNSIKFNICKADTKKVPKEFHHLIITKTVTGIQIKNNIKDCNTLKIFDDIQFYVVDKNDPNILHDKFLISRKNLKKKIIKIELKEDITNKAILYNHNYISVLFKQEL